MNAKFVTVKTKGGGSPDPEVASSVMEGIGGSRPWSMGGSSSSSSAALGEGGGG